MALLTAHVTVKPSGHVARRIIAPRASTVFDLASLVQRFGQPHRGLPERVNDWRQTNNPRLLPVVREWAAMQRHHLATVMGMLYLYNTSVEEQPGLFMGLASLRLVTTAGMAFVVDAFQNSVELETMKYHGIGLGTNAENASDTALQTELTTQYVVNSTRATGTTTEGASSIVYRTVATNTVDADVAITEHGIFSNATVASGVLLDRSVFSADNLTSGGGLETTYDITFTAGG